MTQIDRDELEELIRRVIAEDRSEAMAHPARREKFTKYTDPEGKTWVSMTLERTEVAQKIIVLFISLCSLLSLVNYAVITYAVMPTVHHEIDVAINEHEVKARARMNEMLPNIVTRNEFTAWTSEKQQKWDQQDEFNADMKAAMLEMQKDIKELLRRVR